jgi:hypothetical protein
MRPDPVFGVVLETWVPHFDLKAPLSVWNLLNLRYQKARPTAARLRSQLLSNATHPELQYV